MAAFVEFTGVICRVPYERLSHILVKFTYPPESVLVRQKILNFKNKIYLKQIFIISCNSLLNKIRVSHE